MSDLPDDFRAKLAKITAKRPRTVIDHILQHGHITTEELKEQYGYNHPPRAARDVREQGVALKTFRVTGSDGRSIGAYAFDPTKTVRDRLGGRRAWPKKFKDALVEAYDSRCAVCLTDYNARYLQIDHRVPYEVSGDSSGELESAEFMLLCGSCNRAKSWSCEHCKNWTDDHSRDVCQSCYWASPESYAHIALRILRRLDVVWTEGEVSEYDHLVELSRHARQELPDFVKAVLRDHLKGAYRQS